MKTNLLSPLFFCLLLAGCTADRAAEVPSDTTDAPDPAATAPADTPSQSDSPAAPDSLSEADAREVLRAVYRPIYTFYQRMDTSGTGDTRPPEGMRTPETLVDTLTQTMAPALARSFSEQLLMQRGDGYIVRPTEKILIPYGRPALEAVTVTREDSAYILTERYAKTVLRGRVERQNVVRWEEGQWRLVDIRQ